MTLNLETLSIKLYTESYKQNVVLG